jgi:hypothetical protein
MSEAKKEFSIRHEEINKEEKHKQSGALWQSSMPVGEANPLWKSAAIIEKTHE